MKPGCIMADLSCNDFKKAFESEFGRCEFRAVSGDKVIQSNGFIDTDKLKSVRACFIDSKVVRRG